MIEKVSLKKNYLYNVVYQILLIIVPLITAPYISRKLGPEVIGQQAFCYSIATYFMLFIMLGVTNYGNRSIAKVRDNREELSKTFWSIFGFQFIRALGFIALYIVYLLAFEPRYYLISIINGIYVFSGILDINWFFFGIERFKLTVTRNIVIKILNVICIFVFIKAPQDIWKYSLLISLVAIVSNGYLWFYLRRYVDWYRPKLSDLIPHMKPEIILFVPVLSVSLYKVLDRVLLGAFSTDLDVGFFTQSETVINIPMSLITALGTVMLPRISYMIAEGKIEKTKKYIEISITFAMLLGYAMMFGLSAIAPTFAPAFFGAGYEPCSILIIGLSTTIVFISWANVIRTQYLIPNSKDKEFLVSILVGAAVNIVINLQLIPLYGANGAMVATICAEVTVCMIQTVMVRKELPILRYFLNSVPFLVFGMIMFVTVRMIDYVTIEPVLKLVIEIFVGIIVYAILTLLYSMRSNSLMAQAIKQLFHSIVKTIN